MGDPAGLALRGRGSATRQFAFFGAEIGRPAGLAFGGGGRPLGGSRSLGGAARGGHRACRRGIRAADVGSPTTGPRGPATRVIVCTSPG